MTKTLTVAAGWWEDEFPFDVDDDADMDALHEVLPRGYFVSVDLSAGYDAPGESNRYIHLLTTNNDD